MNDAYLRDDWSTATWFVTLGTADAFLWGFDVDDRWMLRYSSPANGMLAILPRWKGRRRAGLADASWIADCIAFDHDAPVGILPWFSNRQARYPAPPVVPWPGEDADHWYFRHVQLAHAAAVELRFGGSYCLRYEPEDDRSPGTDFARRFAGREGLLALYAMASRQADVLAEYLCLYRVLEGADGGKGMAFAAANLGRVLTHDYGVLPVFPDTAGHGKFVDAFDVYRRRASSHLRGLARRGVMNPADVASYLYGIRNSLAHGKAGVRTADYGNGLRDVAGALPVVKLLARLAVEPGA